MSEEQRLELVARATEIGNLTDTLAAITASEAETAATRDRLTAELDAARARLAEEEKTRTRPRRELSTPSTPNTPRASSRSSAAPPS